MDYLILRLYAPMVSWSAPAIGENRPSEDAPAAGNILGLLAAALGIKRDDEAEQLALKNSLRFAVKTISRGTLLRDYHTVQMPESKRGVSYTTRRGELQNKAQVGTLLSSRDYRCDGLWLIAIQTVENGDYDLPTLQQAIKQPFFPLYFGRKSCPPAAPLAPTIVQAPNWRAAFEQAIPSLLYSAERAKRQGEEKQWRNSQRREDYLLAVEKDYRNNHRQVSFQWSGAIAALCDDVNLAEVQTFSRWDEPINRQRWQFQPRQIHRWHTTEEA